MRIIMMVLSLCFLGFSCAPNTSSTFGSPNPGTTVDQNSYNSLLDVKWCQPVVAQLVAQPNFKISWIFTKDFIASWEKIDLQSNLPVANQKLSWRLENKTLEVVNPVNNAILFKKDISFDYDIPNAKKLMNWQTLTTPTQCQNGVCSQVPIAVMTLTECP